MDIQTLRTIMELQAVQSIQTNNTTTTATDSTFSSMLSQVLQEQIDELGAVASLYTTTATNTATDYVQSLTYSGQIAQSILTAITNTSTKQSTEETSQQAPIISTVKEGSSKIVNNYEAIISKAAAKYDIPEKLITSVIKQESNFKNEAKSSAGAAGLMQLMPATASYLGVTNRLDPEQNIMGGAKYLSQMLNKYDGDLKLALAAYNAGPGNVDKYGGIPPFKETQNYVQKIMATYQS